MKKRCLNPKQKGYEYYGGRKKDGVSAPVTICARWLDPENGFQNFLSDMGPKPTHDPVTGKPAKFNIDRMDGDLGYWCGKSECPECGPLGRESNCKWATKAEDRRHQSDIKNHTYMTRAGVETTMCLKDWAVEYGMSQSILWYRTNTKKMSIKDAIETPLRPHPKRKPADE